MTVHNPSKSSALKAARVLLKRKPQAGFTNEEILKIRHAYRNGGNARDMAAAIGWDWENHGPAFVGRLRRLGIPTPARGSTGINRSIVR